MSTQQTTDLRVVMAGCFGIALILPFVEWHEVRPAALASVAMMVGAWFGLAIAVAVREHNANQ